MRNPIRWLLASFVVAVGLVFVGADRAEAHRGCAHYPSFYGSYYQGYTHQGVYPRYTSYYGGYGAYGARAYRPPIAGYPYYYRYSYARPYVPYFRIW